MRCKQLRHACAGAQQIADAVWMSMLLSAFAGVLAVTVVVATFYFIRWTMCEGPACPPLCSVRHLHMEEQVLHALCAACSNPNFGSAKVIEWSHGRAGALPRI